MPDRDYIEAKENWVATFRRTAPGVRDEFDCLMRTVKGGYYWYTPDYKGLFLWGATRDFHLGIFQDNLREGYLELVKGNLPKELQCSVSDSKNPTTSPITLDG